MRQLRLADSGPAVAQQFAELLVSRIDNKFESDFHLALSGGSTPQLLFELLAKEEFRFRIRWERVHLYWGDERLVPYTDVESNYGITKQRLLDHIDVPAENVHPVNTSLPPEEAATDYAKVIEQHVDKNKEGQPVFDLIMLGMGSDGHTASIFPDQMDLLTSSEATAVATHPDTGQLRVTLTGTTINRAKEIAFLITGTSKAERVEQIINQKEGYLAFPAAHIHPTNGFMPWFLDRHAAHDIL